MILSLHMDIDILFMFGIYGNGFIAYDSHDSISAYNNLDHRFPGQLLLCVLYYIYILK